MKIKICKMFGYGESDRIYWIYDKSKRKMFKSRDVKFNENSVLNQFENEFDITKTGLDEAIINGEVIEENDQDDEIDEEKIKIIIMTIMTIMKMKMKIITTITAIILIMKIISMPILILLMIMFQYAWGSDVDNLNSKSDTEILPSKRTRKQTKRYVPGESMTKKNKSNNQRLANLVNIIDDEPETYEEAINSQLNLKWKEAIKSEVDALIEIRHGLICLSQKVRKS